MLEEGKKPVLLSKAFHSQKDTQFPEREKDSISDGFVERLPSIAIKFSDFRHIPTDLHLIIQRLPHV